MKKVTSKAKDAVKLNAENHCKFKDKSLFLVALFTFKNLKCTCKIIAHTFCNSDYWPSFQWVLKGSRFKKCSRLVFPCINLI